MSLILQTTPFSAARPSVQFGWGRKKADEPKAEKRWKPLNEDALLLSTNEVKAVEYKNYRNALMLALPEWFFISGYMAFLETLSSSPQSIAEALAKTQENFSFDNPLAIGMATGLFCGHMFGSVCVGTELQRKGAEREKQQAEADAKANAAEGNRADEV